MRAWRRREPGSVGLVPTMGFLHEGHLSLVRAARAANHRVAVSIFVNPAQFGPNEDLGRYPRDLERDLALLSGEGVDAVFVPAVEEVYPRGFGTEVMVKGVTEGLEGARRPGHFAGVATVVAKLFNVVEPDRAYFGQKDAQQAVVITRMVADLDFPLGVIVCPIVREADGLALSSRNAYLNPEERRAAPVLYRALSVARELFAGGERGAGTLKNAAMKVLEVEPLATVDYVSVADPETLEEHDAAREGSLVSLAVRIGGTRLIDNVVL